MADPNPPPATPAAILDAQEVLERNTELERTLLEVPIEDTEEGGAATVVVGTTTASAATTEEAQQAEDHGRHDQQVQEEEGEEEEEEEDRFMVSSSSSGSDDENDQDEDAAFHTPFTSLKTGAGRPQSASSVSHVKKQLFLSATTPVPSTIQEGFAEEEDMEEDVSMQPGPSASALLSPALQFELPSHLPTDPVELQLVVSELALVYKASEAERAHLRLQVRALRCEETRLLAQAQQMAAREKDLEEHLLLLSQTKSGPGTAGGDPVVTLDLLRGQILEATRRELTEAKAALAEARQHCARLSAEKDAKAKETESFSEALREEIARLASQLASKTVLASASKRDGGAWKARAEAEAARAEELKELVQGLRDELRGAEKRLAEEESGRREAEALATTLGDRLQQARAELLDAQAQLRSVAGELDAYRRGRGSADAAEAMAAQMDALTQEHQAERLALEEELQAVRAELKGAREATTTSTPVRAAAGASPLFSPSYDVEKGMGHLLPQQRREHNLSDFIGLQRTDDGDDRKDEGTQTLALSSSSSSSSSLYLAEAATQEQQQEQQAEELFFWQNKAALLDEECHQLRQALCAQEEEAPHHAHGASAHLATELRSLHQRLQDEEALRAAQTRRMRKLAAKISACEVDLGEEELVLLPDDGADDEEDELPLGLGDILEGISRWATLWKARAWEDAKTEVRELEELRLHDHGDPSTSKDMVDSWMQTEEASSTALEQAAWEHARAVTEWQARVAALEEEVRQQRLVAATETTNARRAVAQQQEAEAFHATDKARLQASEETAVVVAKAVAEAKETWAEDEQRRLHHLYATFDQEKALKEHRWREKLQDIGQKVKFLQGALTKLTSKAKEKDREAARAVQALGEREGQVEELRARVERLGRDLMVKDLRLRELSEGLRRERKEAVALAAASSQASTTAAELDALEKRLRAEQEKELAVVVSCVRKKYRSRMAALQSAWEEERQALLQQKEKGSSSSSSSLRPRSHKNPAVAAAAATAVVAPSSIRSAGHRHHHHPRPAAAVL